MARQHLDPQAARVRPLLHRELVTRSRPQDPLDDRAPRSPAQRTLTTLRRSGRRHSSARRFATAISALLAAASGVIGCHRAGEPASSDRPVAAAPSAIAGPPPNVLLITVDTLRADHLSAWG